MKTLKKTISMLMVASMVLTAGVVTTSCDEDGNYNTSQMKGGVSLTAAQMQVTRGSYMQFKGCGLDQISSIVFPVEVSATPEVVDKYTIRCIVPEEATVGQVKLIYGGGEIVTEEVLGFNEPVEITDYTKSAKAGEVVTVSGRYLEYFTHARFATGEAVKLQSVSRNEVKAVVPATASTGEMVLVYYTTVAGEQIANETPVGEITLAQPAVASVATISDIYPGDAITIKGTDLNLIDFITLPGGIKVKDFKGDASVVTFNAPAEMQAGTIVSTSFAGITTNLATVAPKAATITALVNADNAELADTVKNGKELIIKGSDLNLVGRIEFVGADAVTTFTVNEAGTEIKVAMPAMAKSGEVKLIAKSEAVATTKVVTLKPTCTGVGPWPQLAGQKATFYGTDMDLIKSITLPSGEILSDLTDRTETSVTALIPFTASGAQFASVLMNNGEMIEQYQWVDVTAVSYCYPTSIAKSYQAGTTGALSVANIDKLTGVKMAGKEVTYIVYDKETLYLPMTFANVGETKVELISGTEVFETVVNIVAGEVEEVIFDTPTELVSWENHEMKDIVLPEIPDGAKIRIRYTKTSDDPAIQVFNGHWQNIWAATDGNENQELLKSSDYVEFDPAVIFEFSDWGYPVIFQGQGLIISSITWVKDFSSAPKAIWEGNFSTGGWAAGLQDLAWGGYDWSQVSAGQTLYAYLTRDAGAEYAQVRFGNGSWAALPSTLAIEGADGDGNISIDESVTELSFTLTEADMDQLLNAGGLVMCGANYTITKIAIK